MNDTGRKLHPVVMLRLYTDEKCFGPGVAMLLQRVRTLHSLRSAAMDMNMAYSKAWTILREAERGFGCKLIISTTGGKNGGGATLTEMGNAILDAYLAYQQQLTDVSDTLFRQYFGPIKEQLEGGIPHGAQSPLEK